MVREFKRLNAVIIKLEIRRNEKVGTCIQILFMGKTKNFRSCLYFVAT